MITSEKIHPEHLSRPALVYIRQSTPGQVRHHQESRRRQYDLAQHARALGWADVVVIDEDLGKSGASAVDRRGFQRLVAEVSLGRAGVVVGLEVSRLARNNRDWYQLLDLCGLMHTLIAGGDGVYDPRDLNDRLLLGLKGTMSEAELGWLRQRAQAGLLAKARRGELHCNLPVGYVATRDGHIEKDPDRRVQETLTLVFQRFAALGSIRQVLLWLRQEQILLPVETPAPADAVRLCWRAPVYGRVHAVLTNPLYAGAYAFGRTETLTRVQVGGARKSRGHRRAVADWLVLLPDHHEGYIDWATYRRNQALITENAQMKGLMVRGAVRHGASLLAGLLRCGRCGRRLHVQYSGPGRTVARYVCVGAQLTAGADRCISFGGLRVDEAIEREVLRVLTPGAIEAACIRATQVADASTAARRAVELELREARCEAERARRQYDAVEPEHRLVAETLEARWNEALARVQTLERRLATAPEPPASPPDRAALLTLAQDFPALWADPATDNRAKKRLVRLLLEEIVARVPEPTVVELVLHWAGGKHTALRLPRNLTGHHRHCTSREVIDVVRDLARICPDQHIGRILNRLGYRTGAGNTWTQTRVTSLRGAHGIPAFRVDPALVTMDQAAVVLGVSAMTVRRMIAKGLLPAQQPVPYAPWTIRREDLFTERVPAVAETVKQGGTLPRTASGAQLSLVDPTT